MPALTGGGLAGGATLLESFGRVPLGHVLVLIVIGCAVLGGYLL